MNDRIRALQQAYGDGADGAVPTAAQWQRLLALPGSAAPTLINFFALRDRAQYPADGPVPDAPGSGRDAFTRYSAVSAPALEKVGGRFLLVAPFAASLVGADEDWDLVAIGTYPDVAAVLALFEDAAYRDAFAHRRAACARQKVLVAG